jgi:hypothetical protein
VCVIDGANGKRARFSCTMVQAHLKSGKSTGIPLVTLTVLLESPSVATSVTGLRRVMMVVASLN